MENKLVTLIVLMTIHSQVVAQSPDYSIPALQKCDFNRLPDRQTEVVVPAHRMTIREQFVFRLAPRCATRLPHCMVPCSTPMTQLQIPFSEPPTIPPSLNSSNSTAYYEVDDEPVIHFTPKAYLRVENEYFSAYDYCVYANTNEHLVVRVCPSKCSSEDYAVTTTDITQVSPDPFEVCVPKCCSLHKVLDPETDSCEYTSTGTPWAPLVYRSSNKQLCGEKRANLKLHYVQTAPNCESFLKYFLKSVPGSTRVRFRLLTNGSVVLRELGAAEWTLLEPGTYCMDGARWGDTYKGEPLDQVLLLCDHVHIGGDELVEDENGRNDTVEIGERDTESRLTASGIAYIILLFSGIPFLLVTELVYVLAWSHQNVHGWTLFSHTLAVLLHYFAQGVANTVSRILTSDENASGMCMIVGVLNHLAVLASFCWLTVINYDLFSMFRHLKTTVGRSRGLKRFLVYSVIAWGIPLIVVTISVVLDKMFGLYGDDGDCEIDVVVPLYGHKSCYIVSEAMPYYLYYPVGVLMLVNLVLALMTFVNMYRHERESTNAHGEFRKPVKHRRKFSVMAKLFVVMGLVWVFEVMVWCFIKENEVLPWYLIFPDVFNVLQAVAIFLLFACQPKILNQVAEKYPRMTGFTNALKKLSCGRKPDKQNGSSVGTAMSNVNTKSKSESVKV